MIILLLLPVTQKMLGCSMCMKLYMYTILLLPTSSPITSLVKVA